MRPGCSTCSPPQWRSQAVIDRLPLQEVRGKPGIPPGQLSATAAAKDLIENFNLIHSSWPYRRIVGRRGSGKSTLVKFGCCRPLSRWDPGEILLDGLRFVISARRPARGRSEPGESGGVPVPRQSGRKHRLRQLWGHPGGDSPCAQLAEASGFNRALPEGYDTVWASAAKPLGRAPTATHRPGQGHLEELSVLILDEGHAAVDNETEAASIVLELITAERTTLVIAAPVEHVRHADCALCAGGRRIIGERPA